MGAEDGQKRAEFKPPYVQFTIALVIYAVVIVTVPEPQRLMAFVIAAAVFIFIIYDKETAYIQSPIGHTRKPHFDALNYLLA